MTAPLRLVIAVIFLGLSLSACGGGAELETAAEVAAAPNTPISDSNILTATFMAANNQAEVTRTINEARNGGQSDEDISEALGRAYLRAPRRRVMFSVNFIHFRQGSATEASVLDTAYESGRTPPAEVAAQARADAAALRAEEEARAAREAEEQAAETRAQEETQATEEVEEETDEDEEPRQRGWRRWVPGL